MNIKLDENLPERLVSELRALGHDVDTVRAEQLARRDDTDIWQAAQSVDRFQITQDLDFSDVRRYTPGTHAGLLLLRLVRPGRDALVARVTMLFATFATEPVDQWRGCLVSASSCFRAGRSMSPRRSHHHRSGPAATARPSLRWLRINASAASRWASRELNSWIEARKVDCVVVYKVDRLSRSLLDFARIMEQFDRNNVSFVSITQQFNTTTSLGRLTLDILLLNQHFQVSCASETGSCWKHI